MHVRTVVVQLAACQFCFTAGTSETCSVFCPRLALPVLWLSRKTLPTHIPGLKLVPYENHAFAYFINSSISHTQMA